MSQPTLFEAAALEGGPRRVELACGVFVLHVPGWLSAVEAAALEGLVRASTAWEQRRLGGRPSGPELPRLTAWVGDTGAVYRYSGITNVPAPWSAELLLLRGRIDAAVRAEVPGWEGFNGCLLNRYRHGEDSVGWHRDNEDSLGPPTRIVVASVSLGARRRFQLRALDGGARIDFRLGHGDLFIMGPGVQTRWEHGAPKDPTVPGERISLNWRRVAVSRSRPRASLR